MHGSITGEVLTVVQNEKIVQKWRLKHWPADVFSTVTLMFFQVDASTCRCRRLLSCVLLPPTTPPHCGCRLSLSQSGVPLMDAQGNTDVIDNVKKGWQSNFFERWAPLCWLLARPLSYLLVVVILPCLLRSIKRTFGYGHVSLPD
jgi:hypothetical protein